MNKVALSVQPGMKKDLREVWLSPNRAAAEVAIDVFAEKYGAKYPKAVECLTKDRQPLLAFYDFPAEHWDHLRTSNPLRAGDGACPAQDIGSSADECGCWRTRAPAPRRAARSSTRTKSRSGCDGALHK